MGIALVRLGARAVDLSAALGSLFLVLLVCAQVVSRAFLSSSIPWSEEVTAYVMVWTALLGTASHMQHGRFMALSLWKPERRPLISAIFFWVSVAATILFLAMIFWIGLKVSVFAPTSTLSPAARFPMWIVYLAFPVAAALIVPGFLLGEFRNIPKQERETC